MIPRRPAFPAAAFSFIRVLFMAALPIIPLSLLASTPSWWTDYGVLNGNPSNDFAPANQGQAKNFAVAAVSLLNNDLAQFRGAGPRLDQLAAAFISGASPRRNDFAPVTLGHLKTLAQPFYDRLLDLGYTGPPLTSGTYPWAVSHTPPNDNAVANIGQLKNLFTFDLTHGSYWAHEPYRSHFSAYTPSPIHKSPWNP